MLELLFGTHVGGWQAMVQFWFWATVLFTLLLFFYKRGNNGN
jgi:hypothetical protein